MSSTIQMRRMTEADLPLADQVRAYAGWNQTPDDWRLLLEWQPDGCFVGEWNGVAAGTATTICYGTDLAWIGMVLPVLPGSGHSSGCSWVTIQTLGFHSIITRSRSRRLADGA